MIKYSTEFPNSLEPLELSPHRLKLKGVIPISLLQNFDQAKHSNGIRLVVKRLMPHVIEGTVLRGCDMGMYHNGTE